ncbi:MAG: hypothetical protein EZS28_018239 [Streblomastix strix]|uniref:Uncharacterized protein n=1 Tax=Streblomastix strix TaxID=222440 RepID=A0A5J4VUT8_9EUKA|nr:MAG: hypothetical protein EZS28_018239 [Streblomastix strix]
MSAVDPESPVHPAKKAEQPSKKVDSVDIQDDAKADNAQDDANIDDEDIKPQKTKGTKKTVKKEQPAKKPKKIGKKAKAKKTKDEDNNSDDGEEMDESGVAYILKERHQEKIKKLVRDIKDEYSLDDLKNMCKKNDLSQFGEKWMLLDRVADAMVNGPPERCPSCKTGFVYFDKKKLLYCCRCSYTSKTIKREEWKD